MYVTKKINGYLKLFLTSHGMRKLADRSPPLALSEFGAILVDLNFGGDGWKELWP